MTVHWPRAFVGPLPQVPPVMLAPTRPPIDGVTVTPAAATKPAPEFFSTVTVKVCGELTWFVPDSTIVMRASTHVFWLLTVNAP